MTAADLVLAILWVGISAYAIFGGADFGAGFWDLLAGGAERGKRQRELIEHSVGPVWEANHVWLIFVLVVLWTGFESAFASIASTLYIPLTLVAVGVILRGAGFAFRKAVTTIPQQRLFGATFALSSVVTPYFLGTVAGAVASGRVPPGNAAGNIWTSWNNPTSWLGGVLAVLVCADVAAVFLAADASKHGDTELAQQFRLRALIAAACTGVVAFVGIAVLHHDAPILFHGLTHRALPVVLLSAVAGVVSMLALWRRLYVVARFAVAIAVAAVLWGWALGQYPYVLVDTTKIADAAGPTPTMHALLWALSIGSVLLIPSLFLLFELVRTDKLSHDD